ncbi:MAG: HTH domain-containing protein [Parcubacteria group bacterium]|nr:HTH domain-containing protein [Parcubacteria group bacterium]
MQQLNERQKNIVGLLSKNNPLSNSQIVEAVGVSRFTVLRDLELLQELGIIKKEGKGRNTRYYLLNNNFFDIDDYFNKGPDERDVKLFNLDFLKKEIFTEKEYSYLNDINKKYRDSVSKMNKTQFRKEMERLTIELSWKSSQIEGNTYTLIDTEMLIKEMIEAVGKKKEEAIMILNHKDAIDYILENKDKFKKVNLFEIEKIHQLLTKGLGINYGIRNNPVRIIGTRYLPPSNRSQIVESINLIIDKINKTKDSFSKALLSILMISYLQPFEDGNKRTSRILGNAILLANDICPLSYRSVNESDYKKGMILFYEQNYVKYFKELFVEQFKFAVDNYF